MVLCVDLDNTIFDTVSMIINLHNRLNENKLKYNKGDKLGWKFEPLIKTDEELAELFKLFDHKDFYKHPIIFKYAKDIINGFSKRNKVYIISKHQDSRKDLTREWVNKTFPRVELIFVDNFEDKGRVLKELGADIIVDDRVDALESCEGIVPYRICYGNYEWNKDYKGLRATNWKGLYKMIREIRNTIESNKEMVGIERCMKF